TRQAQVRACQCRTGNASSALQDVPRIGTLGRHHSAAEELRVEASQPTPVPRDEVCVSEADAFDHVAILNASWRDSQKVRTSWVSAALLLSTRSSSKLPA